MGRGEIGNEKSSVSRHQAAVKLSARKVKAVRSLTRSKKTLSAPNWDCARRIDKEKAPL